MIKSPIQPMPVPRHVYVIGDSHCLPFKDTMFQDPTSGQSFITKIAYCSGLSANSILDSKGNYCDTFQEGLRNLGLMDKDGKALYLASDPNSLAATFAAGLPQSPPTIILTCTEIDFRALVLSRLKNDHDIILPFETVYPNSNKPIIPLNFILDIAESTIGNLIKGLKPLADKGLSQVLVHCIPPPTLNDELFVNINNYLCPIPVRYKAATLWNHIMRKKCAEAGIPFIDLWPDVTENGYLLPRYELDGVHLSRHSVKHSLEYFTGYIHSQRFASVFNHVRYQLANEHGVSNNKESSLLQTLRNLVKQPDESQLLLKAFKKQGVVHFDDDSMILKAVGKLDQQEVLREINHSFDWRYDPQHAPEAFITQPPSDQWLESVYNTLYAEPFHHVLSECLGGDPIFYSLSISTQGLTSQSTAEFSYPKGIMRAIIAMQTQTEGASLLFKDAQDREISVAQRAGTLTVFDPNRLKLVSQTGFSPDAPLLHLVMGLRHKNHPRLLAWSPTPAFPVDPFQFSTTELNTYPKMTAGEFSVNPRFYEHS